MLALASDLSETLFQMLLNFNETLFEYNLSEFQMWLKPENARKNQNIVISPVVLRK